MSEFVDVITFDSQVFT